MKQLERLAALLVDELDSFDKNIIKTRNANSGIQKENEKLAIQIDNLNALISHLRSLEIKPNLTELLNIESNVNKNIALYTSGISKATEKAIEEFTQSKNRRLLWHKAIILFLTFGISVIGISFYRVYSHKVDELIRTRANYSKLRSNFSEFINENDIIKKEYAKWSNN